MKAQHILILFSLIWLQACSSVTGPVHFYAGQPRPDNETARLKVPAAITVVKIDGKKVKAPSKDEGFYQVYLLPGLHRIDFKYELAWGDNVSGMLIRSEVVGVETRLYAGKNYELKYAVPAGQEEAYEMAMATEFKAALIEKETGRQVASRSTSELDEFRITVANAPVTTGIAVRKEASASETKTTGTITPAGINADTATREDAVKRLKFWWLMASEVERERFRRWMKQVDSVEKTGAE